MIFPIDLTYSCTPFHTTSGVAPNCLRLDAFSGLSMFDPVSSALSVVPEGTIGGVCNDLPNVKVSAYTLYTCTQGAHTSQTI
ncbi:hypothetical protein EON63_22450 [archaeon]|nr:MAG: hypothetical protein EON63_22450 [archaeon]